MSDFFGLPVLASEHGATVDQALIIVHGVMLVALILWGGVFYTALFKFRRKKHPQADYHGLRSKLPYVAVAVLAVVELVMLFGISLPFWEHQVVAMPEDPDPVEVRVIAQQFQWNVHYPGPDGLFGQTAIALIDEQVNPLGLDPKDPAGTDDFTTRAQLYLPVNRTALIHLGSKDVIHGFALPEFRVKQDAIPGMSIPVHFKPTMTSEEFKKVSGDEARGFEIACAQLCGINHYFMRGFVTIQTQEQFDDWVAKQVKAKQEQAEESW